MGWRYNLKQPKNFETFFKNMYTFDGNCYRNTALACAIVEDHDGHTAYLAIEVLDHFSGTREVFAAVILLDLNPNDGTFGYKEQEEAMGPRRYHCPRHILELLTPLPTAQVYTDDMIPGVWARDPRDWAKDWRRRCWANVQHTAATAPQPPSRLRRIVDLLWR